MDINSLLSPSGSPASPPPRRPSLLRKTQSTSVTPSTALTSISSHHSYSGAIKGSSPLQTTSDPYHSRYQTAPPTTATAGIDTLADVASLQQQHNSKPRALVAAEIIRPQNPLPSSYAALSTWQASTDNGDARSTPARIFRAASLAGNDQEEIAKLVTSISANGFDYTAHTKLIQLLHKGFVSHMEGGDAKAHNYELVDDLRRARKAMDDRFPVGEALWADWIADESLLAQTLEERIEVMELCKRAVEEEVNSTRLWKIYGDWVLRLYESGKSADGLSADEQELVRELFSWETLIDVWRQAASATKWQLNDSNIIWDQYMEFLQEDVNASATSPKISSLKDVYINRLRTPHSTWDQTFQNFSTFITQYDNENYEETMVHVSKLGAEAKQKFEDRELFELKLRRAASDDELWSAYAEYIEFETTRDRSKKELDTHLCAALFERALLKFGVEASLWEDYVFFVLDKAGLGPESIPVLPILNRATRHCPWSGTLWSQYVLSAEKGFKPFHEIETIKHHATQGGLIDIGGLDEVLKVLSAWCGFLKRRAFSSTATEEEIDVAELGIRSALESANELGSQKYGQDYRGDPQMRLERIYIGFLCNIGSWDQARQVWESMYTTRGSNYSYWFRYYRWEMYCWGMSENGNIKRETPQEARPGPPTQATAVLRRAVQQDALDWPDKIYETFINHVEDHEDVEVVQGATVLLRKQTKLLAQRREKAIAAGEYVADPYQAGMEQQPLSAKRKWEGEEGFENGISKKSRVEDESVDPMDTAEDGQAAKRNREHTTAIVRHLPSDVTEAKIKHYFRECGEILGVVIAQEGSSATATIEFETEEGVLAAVTKDMKKFEGHAINVEAGLATTLWVTNFPASADQADIRQLFSEFGEVIDVRLPSLKFNTSRRFCYVQLKSASQAQAALALNGRDLGQKGTLVVKLSDPSRKEDRTGPAYDGREVYVSNVDWSATEDDLRDIFAKYGKIERVRLPTNFAGKSKGMAFVTFASKDEADASLELNATKFKSRILTVQISEATRSKKPGTHSGRVRSSSPQVTNGHTGPPHERSEAPSASTIRSKTFAILGLPDTFNAARLEKILSPYGKLLKVQLRPDHGGAIVEFESVADAGKAELALDGMEVEPGTTVQVGTVPQLLKSSERETAASSMSKRNEKISRPAAAAARISRPAQPGSRGGRGGLGVRRKAPSNGTTATQENGAEAGTGAKKSNADFRAMFSAV